MGYAIDHGCHIYEDIQDVKSDPLKNMFLGLPATS